MIKRFLNYYRRHFWDAERYARFIGVKIGRDCAIASKNFGSEPYLIEIGNHVQITEDVKFLTHSGLWIFRDEYPDFDAFGKIKVGNNVYIGNNVLIMPGVTIGNDVMVGAGSVVTKSIADNVVVAGNPAKQICNIEEVKQRMLLVNVNTKCLKPQDKMRALLSMSEDKFIKK